MEIIGEKNNKCKDCIYFAESILCCMAVQNEGMRVFDKNNKICQYFIKNYFYGN